MIEEALIPSISIDGLLAARDAVQVTYLRIRDALLEAAALMQPFEVEIPRVEIMFPGGQYRNLCDPHYQDSIRREIDRHIWLRLFAATNVELLMDSKTRRDLQEKLHRSGIDHRDTDTLPEVTRENIESTWKGVTGRAREFFENGVESVYRSLSWDHKTNTPGLIGDTLIVNGAYYYWARRYQGETATISHHETLQDLERVLALLDSQPAPTHETGMRGLKQVPFGVWTPVPAAVRPLMSIKVYRKGTTHVRILNPEHVRALNAIMARRYPAAIGTGDRHKGRQKRAAKREAEARS